MKYLTKNTFSVIFNGDIILATTDKKPVVANIISLNYLVSILFMLIKMMPLFLTYIIAFLQFSQKVL
jgi:hypothetical protein